MKDDKSIISEYISAILCWAYNDTRRGEKTIRAKIKKLGDELVKRGLLTQDDADAFYRGDII